MFTHLVRSVFRLRLNQSTFFFTLSLRLKTDMNRAVSDSTQRQHLCLYCVQTLTTVACGFKQLGRASGGMASIKSALMSSACNKETTYGNLWISFVCLFVFFEHIICRSHQVVFLKQITVVQHVFWIFWQIYHFIFEYKTYKSISIEYKSFLFFWLKYALSCFKGTCVCIFLCNALKMTKKLNSIMVRGHALWSYPKANLD